MVNSLFVANKLSPMVSSMVAAITMLLIISGCTTSEAPPVPTVNGTVDSVLEQGRNVFMSNCSRCHGSNGGGGAGIKLSEGRATELHPDIATMINVVNNGKNGMPAFGKALSEADIEAVVRYVREVL